MKLSQRITAFAMLGVMVVCMSGYMSVFLEGLNRLGLISYALVEIRETGIDEPLNEQEDPVKKSQGFLSFKNKVENQFNRIAFKQALIELSASVNRIVGKRLIIDVNESKTVVKLKNGHLTSIRSTPSVQIEEYAQNVIDLYENLTAQGIEVLYANMPFKIDKYDDQLPDGIVDYTNSDADRLLEILCQNMIPTVDFREEIRQVGLNHYEQFFYTDHHWTPETGLWAAGVLMNNHLPKYRHTSSIELYEIENYTVATYEKTFLGSYGRRTGFSYAGADDISIITPKFNSDLQVSVPSNKYSEIGDFSETIIDVNIISGDFFDNDPYGAYVGGNASAQIKNDNGNGYVCVVI